jgi:enamine deaminase RidA (YjgF/YER057c/UK114 family)
LGVIVSQAEDRLKELNLELPTLGDALGNYVGAVRTGNLVFLSGRGPRWEGQFQCVGKLGQDVTVEEGYAAARLTALNLLASLKTEIGDLDRVTRIVKLVGMVASDPSFTDQPSVVNGASDLLVAVFGDRGKHARSSLGVAVLPMNTSVEVELIVEVAT